MSEKNEDSKAAFVGTLSPIAVPLANPKLAKNVLKTIKKATKGKDLRRGVKEVVKCIRKGQKGIVVLAGDVSPMDVLSHLPVLCEEASVPYIFVPSKAEMGLASSTKRPTSCLMITAPKDDKAEHAKYFTEIQADIKKTLAAM